MSPRGRFSKTNLLSLSLCLYCHLAVIHPPDDDDDVYYYIRWRLKLEGETENMGVCMKERKGITAAVLVATPCTNRRWVLLKRPRCDIDGVGEGR